MKRQLTKQEVFSSRHTASKKNIFVGVAWPYVNGELHIGHLAGYLLPADIYAKYNRSIGNNVLMVSGSDCFGTPITVEADKQATLPKEIANLYHKRNVFLFKEILGLSFDIYTRTDTDHHIKITQEFFLNFLEKGYIFSSKTKQYFSDKENKFLPDRYIEGRCGKCDSLNARGDQCDNCGKLFEVGELINPRSKLNGFKVSLRDTEHYFIDWAKLQPQIEKYVKGNGHKWKKWVYQETLGWLNKGLKPRAVTRDIDWGVPLPIEKITKNKLIENIENKRLYVWFDAVIGYLSASMLWSKEEQNGEKWKEFWYNPDSEHIYFMGKDNLIFHTIFWPAQLMVKDVNLHLPDVQSVNMFLNLDGVQFSKSKGITLRIEDIVNHYGNDPVRFYLTAIMPEVSDSSFEWSDFARKNNTFLVGNLGNFINRVLSIGYETDVNSINHTKLFKETKDQISAAFTQSRKYIERCEFRSYLLTLLELASYGNKAFDYAKIWVLKKEDINKFYSEIGQHYALILALSYIMSPLLPGTSKKITDTFGINEFVKWPKVGKEVEEIQSLLKHINNKVKPKPLFNKINLADDYNIASNNNNDFIKKK